MLRRFMMLGLVAAIAGCADATGADDSFEGCDQVRGLPVSSPVVGQLTSASCRLPADLQSERPAVDYYRMEVRSSRSVELTLATEDFYANLLLLNPQGQALWWSSGEQVAHIQQVLNPGVYYVAVSTYGENRGQYALDFAMGPE